MMKYADLGDVTLTYFDIGVGLPLLCLHGGMGINSRTLRTPGILDLTKQGIRLIIPDQRGHGRSSRTSDSGYTHGAWVADVRSLAQHLGLAEFALLGHSYGGFLALEYAVRWPTSLTHLVLVATSAGPVRTQSGTYRTDQELREHFRMSWPYFFVENDKHWELFEEADFSVGPYNAAFSRELPLYDVREQIRHVEVPMLAIVGNSDPYRSHMEWLVDNTSHSRLCVLRGGHFPFVETRDDFLNEVASFLNGSVQPAI